MPPSPLSRREMRPSPPVPLSRREMQPTGEGVSCSPRLFAQACPRAFPGVANGRAPQGGFARAGGCLRPCLPPARRGALRGEGREALASATTLYTVNRFVVAGMVSATLGLLIQQRWGDHLSAGGVPVGVATLTGFLLGLSTVTSMIVAPFAGHWSDRADSRWRVVVAGLIPGLAGMSLLAVGLPPLIVLGIPFTAITSGSSQSLATALIGDLTRGAGRGQSLGWMHTFGDLSSAIAPPLAYAVIPSIGLPGIYLMCVVLLAAMLLWSVRLMRVR